MRHLVLCSGEATRSPLTDDRFRHRLNPFTLSARTHMGPVTGPPLRWPQAGEENFFLFGLTAEQVADSRGWYDPFWHYRNEPETRAALELIFNDHFSRNEPGIFGPIRNTLLEGEDYYMHLADLNSYVEAQARVGSLYAEPDAWARKAIINIACSGHFSSDRTIREYAAAVWNAKPCPVD